MWWIYVHFEIFISVAFCLFGTGYLSFLQMTTGGANVTIPFHREALGKGILNKFHINRTKNTINNNTKEKKSCSL